MSTEQDFVDHQATAHFKEFVLGRAAKLLQSRERVPFTILELGYFVGCFRWVRRGTDSNPTILEIRGGGNVGILAGREAGAPQRNEV